MRHKILLFLLFFGMIFGGCALQEGGTESSEASEADAQGYELIFVCPILENEYWESCVEGIRKADAEFGTNTTVVGPQTADNFAVEIVDYMDRAVDAKPDGIMTYAGITGLYDRINRASEEGIPVLAIDSDAPSTCAWRTWERISTISVSVPGRRWSS